MELQQRLTEAAQHIAPSRPQFFDLAQEGDRTALSALLDGGTIAHVIDDYEEQLKELFQIDNPTLVYDPSFSTVYAAHREEMRTQQGGLMQHGRWVFFPWNDTLIHVLEDGSFQRVRTARNRNLITEEEQAKYYNATVGIGGLSVGNSVALSIVLQGGARTIRLADFDRLALSNLNRIRSGIDSLGLRKVEMTARQIYALDPYAQVELFPEGITKENIGQFLDGLDVVIDELDTLAVKLLIREEAAKRKLPVVMGADNGDNAVIDIERYDTEKPPFFHGRLGEVTYDELKSLDKFGIGKTITKHIGPENVTSRMQESLLAMGKTIVSWPQLGGAALANGVAVAYAVRKILTGEPLENNRALISLDEKLVPGYFGKAQVQKRAAASEVFKKMFNL